MQTFFDAARQPTPNGDKHGGIFMARNPARLDNRRGVHLLRQKIGRALKRTPAVGQPALNAGADGSHLAWVILSARDI